MKLVFSHFFKFLFFNHFFYKNKFGNYVRYTFFLLFIFIFIFSVSLVFLLRKNEIHQLIDFKEKDIIFTIKHLQKKNLKIKLYEKIDINTPKYKVISQQPDAGEMVKEGRTISIIVSSGNQFIAMPNYISNKYEEAKREIYSLFAGYKTVPNVVKIERYSTFPQGLIVDQFPKVDENLTPDKEILFVVSQGLVDKAVFITNYRGKLFREVEQELLSKGIKVKVNYFLTDRKKKNGRIFVQSIKSKKFLVPGEEISFDVGIYSATKLKELSNQSGLTEVLHFYSFQVPFKSTDFKNNNFFLHTLKQTLNKDSISDKINKKKQDEITIKSNSKLSTPDKTKFSIHLRKIKLEVEDAIGIHIAIQEKIPSGKMVDLPFKTIGNGFLRVYIDNKLYATVGF